jgi:hypothetical protein
MQVIVMKILVLFEVCDGNTYVNYCIAYHSYGITNYEYGACE